MINPRRKIVFINYHFDCHDVRHWKGFFTNTCRQVWFDNVLFLWFDKTFSEAPRIVSNRLARIVFGVTSSPFLLNNTITKHLWNYGFYVDDFSGGKHTIEKAFELFKLEIRFLEGLFYLRKWRINDPKLRGLISENNENELKPSKILGIIWNEKNDIIVFKFKEICGLKLWTPPKETF